MNFEGQDLVSLLGKPQSDAGVQKLLQDCGLQKVKIRVKRGESDVAVESEKHGIVLNFAELDDLSDVPEGTLALVAIHAMAAGVQGHAGFGGTLPNALSFDMTRSQVRKSLGAPAWSSPALPNDRWIFSRYRVLACFKDDAPTATIASVIVSPDK
jgi:hypothetical protein